jgi:hypothetical protein
MRGGVSVTSEKAEWKMNRRDFFKLAGLGIAGLIAPQWAERQEEMQIGDLLAKIGRGEQLTQEEQQRIRLWGNNTEFNNSFVAGLQNGQSNIMAGEIKSNVIYVKNEVLSGSSIKLLRTTSQSIASSVAEYIEWDSFEYNSFPVDMVNLSVDPTKIYIPTSGRYVIGINVAFDPTSNYWRGDIVKNGVTTPPLASGITDVPVVFSALNFPEDAYLEKGDYIQCRVLQSSGGALNVLGANIYLRWLGTK